MIRFKKIDDVTDQETTKRRGYLALSTDFVTIESGVHRRGITMIPTQTPPTVLRP